jgi:hypothetical protein
MKLDAPRTVLTPVTTMEEVELPSDEERERLIASLADEERRIAAGDHVEHNRATFVAEMMALRSAAREA